MAPTLRASRAHREDWLAALQCLDLALFVYAEHQSIIWRVQIEAQHITNLVDEVGIRGKSEDVLAMRLQAESSPDAIDRLSRKSHARSSKKACSNDWQPQEFLPKWCE